MKYFVKYGPGGIVPAIVWVVEELKKEPTTTGRGYMSSVCIIKEIINIDGKEEKEVGDEVKVESRLIRDYHQVLRMILNA